MVVCWSVKGGVGTTVVAAALALAVAQRRRREVLLVDLGGDLPRAFGIAEPDGPGLAEWLRTGEEVPPDALRRVEVPLVPGVHLLPLGSGALALDRVGVLVALLAADGRTVVVDAGSVSGPAGALAEAVAALADRSILITRACPLAQGRLRSLPLRPTGVVVVRDHRRMMTWADAAEGTEAPVLAEIDVDPAIGGAIDAGLAHRRLPRPLLHALAEVHR